MEKAMFKKAEKSQSKLWLAIYGSSGSGKTMTSLRIAKGIGGKVALIDTERGSASKYSDRFDFDVCNLDDKTIAGYSNAINSANGQGYETLIIDSLSHAWQELIAKVEILARQKYNGNSFRAWAEGTPEQRTFINTILSFKGNVIVTMRSKTEWLVQENDKGKKVPSKVGLAPEQGKGIEYEFDVLLVLDDNNIGHVEKDRSGKFQNQYIDKPSEQFGADLKAWLSVGKPLTPSETPQSDTLFETIQDASPAIKVEPTPNQEIKKDVLLPYGLTLVQKASYDKLYDLLTDAEKEQFKETYKLAKKKDFYTKVPYAVIFTSLMSKEGEQK